MVLIQFKKGDKVSESGLILGLHQANERRRYKVTRLSLAGCKPRISPDSILWMKYDNKMESDNET